MTIEITPNPAPSIEVSATTAVVEVSPLYAPGIASITVQSQDAGGALAARAAAAEAKSWAELAAAPSAAHIDQVMGRFTLSYEFSLNGDNSGYLPTFNH